MKLPTRKLGSSSLRRYVTGSAGLYNPSHDEVEALISRAMAHPLGLGFLREGALDAVSATFQVHAFVVDQAREKLT